MVRRLVVTAAIVLSGWASALAGTPSGSASHPLAVIDAHIQTNFDHTIDETSNVMFSKAELATEMKGYSVVGAVSFNRPGAPYADLSDLNVVQCVGLPEKVDADRLDADLAPGRYRCLTIYLEPDRPYASDPNYEPAYRLAGKYHVPVVFQTVLGENPMILPKSADPLTIEDVAVRYPKVTFVVAHAGNPGTADQRDRSAWMLTHSKAANIWQFGDDPWLAPAAAVTRKNPNVVLDGSAFLVGDLLKASPAQIETYLGKRVNWFFNYLGDPSKMMFGSAWPKVEMGPYLELFKRAIPKEHWQAVFHDNAARVYGFATRPAAQ
jgi:hypothetical protein